MTDVNLNNFTIFSYTFRYWILTSLNVAYTGTFKDGTNFDINEAMNVTLKRGYIKTSNADLSCERGYSTCAPKDLCWSCSDQTIYPNIGSKDETFTSALILSGFKIQPIIGNSSAEFHG